MTKHYRPSLIVLTTLGFGLFVSWVFMPSVWKHRVRMLPDLFELVHPKTHTFHVSGSVVDQDGMPLERVFMDVSEHTPNAANQPPKQQNSSRWIDGSFEVKSEGYKVLTIYFEKPGYKSVKIDFKSGGDFSNCEVRLSKEKGE